MSIHTHMYISAKTRYKEAKRLLFKFVSHFLNKNSCFHKCEGHLFYKTFLLDTIPNVPILFVSESNDISQKLGFSENLAFSEIIKLEIPNFIRE